MSCKWLGLQHNFRLSNLTGDRVPEQSSTSSQLEVRHHEFQTGSQSGNLKGAAMGERREISTCATYPDPRQPRKEFKAGKLSGLSESMKAIGQQVPVIVVADGDKFILVDGECRWRAAQLAGIAALDAIVLAAVPSAAELMVLQASLDAHRSDLSPVERSDFLALIRAETGWSVTELAKRISQPQATVSKLLALQKLSPEIRAKVQTGELDGEKAYLISQEPDASKQLDLLKVAASMTRDQFRQKAKAPVPDKVRTSLARFPLSAGLTVTVQGQAVTLDEAITALADAIKELKRGLAQGVGIDAMQKVMRDKAKLA